MQQDEIQAEPKIIYTGSSTKPWYQSKTIWFNTIALIALVLQSQTGFIISGTEQTAVIVVANLILRSVTTQEIS